MIRSKSIWTSVVGDVSNITRLAILSNSSWTKNVRFGNPIEMSSIFEPYRNVKYFPTQMKNPEPHEILMFYLIKTSKKSGFEVAVTRSALGGTSDFTALLVPCIFLVRLNPVLCVHKTLVTTNTALCRSSVAMPWCVLCTHRHCVEHPQSPQ